MCVYDRLVKSEIESSQDQDHKLIADIKEAVDLLTDEKLKGFLNADQPEFSLKNQNGISIDISKEDTRYLTTAMILHEKAKNLMKSKEYLKALILLAEADNGFK
jgi:hypothetical protein